ncbi:MAG TPA: hypothetical protein VGO09_10490 [Flavisolibacter sp.]|nr:hypothetical protein [Flavisolibacter sp.]
MNNIQHICALAIITIIMGLIYVSVQQVYRTTANDPQIQIAHDIVSRMNEGKSVEKYFAVDTIDLQNSGSVFLEMYNEEGKPLRSTGLLKGELPQLPAGVINFAKVKGEDWVTWQPAKDVRMAMVLVRTAAAPFFIIAVGRSLAEVENRVSRLTTVIFICWILCIIILLASWITQYYSIRSKLK